MVTEALRAQIRARQDLPTTRARRAIRQAAGITQADLARALGVSRETVWRWENADRDPRGQNLIDYLEVLRLMQAEIAKPRESTP